MLQLKNETMVCFINEVKTTPRQRHNMEAILEAPSPKPEVRVATPSRVSVCDALTVDGGDTRGGGGRPLTFSWSAKGSTQGLTDRVSALLAPQKALPTANFDAKDLDAGTYNFTLTVWMCNRRLIG